jgi:predicted TPR repeat methyltransferase
MVRIGAVLLGAGDHTAAAEAFAAATEAAPGLPAAWIGLSDAHRLAKRIKPAIAAFRQAEAVGAERQALRALRFRLFGEWGE